MKLKKKRNLEDNIIYDLEFSEKMHNYVNEILEELKKDGSSAFAILIILFGVFHVKNTWRRVKSLVIYQIKQSQFYSWWQIIKKRSFQGHLESVGLLNFFVKLRLVKLTAVVNKDQNKAYRVLFQEINWHNLIHVGEYLTIKDKMTLCTVNKNTREFYM
jgi:hypothetical protein